MSRLRGHALQHEGKPFVSGAGGGWERIYTAPEEAVGVGLCECGQTSPELGTDAARKRWHVEHKDEVRAAAREGSDAN